MDLKSYDVIVVNSSAGKDSLAMLDYICEMAREQGVLDRVTVVHADLGRVEWAGTKELAERQAVAQGVPFRAIARPQGDLLQHVEARGQWPSNTARYCTSDHKRGQVRVVITDLVRHVAKRPGRRVRVLNCMGMRAQESPAREKLAAFEHCASKTCPCLECDDMRRTASGSWLHEPQSSGFRKTYCGCAHDAPIAEARRRLGDGNSNTKRHVDDWLPLHTWTEKQVWERIRSRGLEAHPAYSLGMPRLSCCFCIFATRDALLIAGHNNRALLAEYVAVEARIGHTFTKKLPIAKIAQAVDAGEQASGKVESWCM